MSPIAENNLLELAAAALAELVALEDLRLQIHRSALDNSVDDETQAALLKDFDTRRPAAWAAARTALSALRDTSLQSAVWTRT